MFEIQKSIKGVEYFSLADALRHFRETFEREAGRPAYGMEVNAALLLDDLCEFLQLAPKHQARVLGTRGAAFVHSLKADRVCLVKRQ